MNLEGYIDILVNIHHDINKIEEFYNKEYITLKELYKIEHRMLDKMVKTSEYYQEILEEKINIL